MMQAQHVTTSVSDGQRVFKTGSFNHSDTCPNADGAECSGDATSENSHGARSGAMSTDVEVRRALLRETLLGLSDVQPSGKTR